MLKWIPALAMLVGLILTWPALGETRFPIDWEIADAEHANAGMVALNAYAPGKVDIAWRDKNGAVRYSSWDINPGTTHPKAMDGETVCGLTHTLLGIGRYKDVIRIGANNSKRLWQWSRSSDGKWEKSDSGAFSITYYGPTAGYDVNPKNGLGAFLALCPVLPKDLDPSQYKPEAQTQPIPIASVYIAEKAPDQWTQQVLVADQPLMARGAFCFTPGGEPIVAVQKLSKPEQILAGKPSKPGVVEPQAHAYFPMAVTADAKGRLHLLVILHTGQTNYYVSTDMGTTWKRMGLVVAYGNYGDAIGTALAVSPKDGSLAALVSDKDHPLMLALSVNGGETWTLEALPGGKVQFPALAYDPAGNLYVAYFNSDKQSLRLLSTAKAPATQPVAK